MIKRGLTTAAAGLAALIMAACTPQMAEDALAGPGARCREAVRLYDEAPGVWVGVLTAVTCGG